MAPDALPLLTGAQRSPGAPLWCGVCSAGAVWAPMCLCNKDVCAAKGSALRTLLGHMCSPCRGNMDSKGDQDSRSHPGPCP